MCIFKGNRLMNTTQTLIVSGATCFICGPLRYLFGLGMLNKKYYDFKKLPERKNLGRWIIMLSRKTKSTLSPTGAPVCILLPQP